MIQFSAILLVFGLLSSNSALNVQDTSTPTKSVTLVDYDTTILPGRSVCGVVKETPKIYGGKAVLLGELPWTVALNYKSPQNDEAAGTLCAGTLINERFVLTSANCVNNPSRIPANAILGEWKLNSDPDCINNECAAPVVKIKVQEVISHESYNKKSGENDIALIRLEKPVVFTEFVTPICLPPKGLPFPKEGEFVTVAGWGKTEKGEISEILLKVDLPIVSSEECGKKIKKNYFQK